MTKFRIEKDDIEEILAKHFNTDKEKVRLFVYHREFDPDDNYAELEIEFK